jgi:predicted GNAT family acetyltransferase
MTTEVRELKREDFSLAEKLWEQYRDQKADPVLELIFAVFADGRLVATARYTRHTDGNEMDCVFVPDQYRGKGYARDAVQELIRVCGSDTIHIHSTIVLIPF